LRNFSAAGLFAAEGGGLAEHGTGPADLPEEPRHHLGASGRVLAEELARSLREVLEDRTGLEEDDALSLLALAVDERRDLPVGIDREEGRRLLLLLGEVDDVHLVRKPQLGKQDGDLLSVGGGGGIEVEHLAPMPPLVRR
jgi:hypothetical protein